MTKNKVALNLSGHRVYIFICIADRSSNRIPVNPGCAVSGPDVCPAMGMRGGWVERGRQIDDRLSKTGSTSFFYGEFDPGSG